MDGPFNMGPTFMQIAGMLTVDAAISMAGVLIGQLELAVQAVPEMHSA